MEHPAPHPVTRPAHHPLFYPLASALLLVLTFIGFRMFYLHLQAYPGRPLTPPIRTLLIVHGVSMTVWMLLAVAQPLLVATGRKRMHMTVGRLTAVLAVGIVISGYLVAVNAARVNPPDLQLFGLNQKEFLTVPLSGILTFGAFVFLGVWQRRRPEIHRPLMFMASLAVVAAAVGRMPVLNDWYAGTRLEFWFSAFLNTLLIGALLLVIKSAVERRFDRWFAATYGVLVVICVSSSLLAKTGMWKQFATLLMG
jgi:hypothetical protein